MMKRIITFIGVAVCIALSSMAQTQQGYVKTIGRPDKPGSPVEGVVLRFGGVLNSVISDNEGRFSVVVREKKNGDAVRLQSVRKAGYEVSDPNLVGRDFVISAEVPFVITVVSKAQLEADKKRIANNAYRVADKNFKAKQKKLEEDVRKSAISAEDYRKELEKLQFSYEKYMSLVGDMADRYARTDYDSLDSIDVEINKCIEAGELERAEELILSVFDPTTVLERNRRAKQELHEKMILAEELLSKLLTERAAITKDIEYSKRIAQMGVRLGDEHKAQGDDERALECYQKSWELLQIIYGRDSEEAEALESKISKWSEYSE